MPEETNAARVDTTEFEMIAKTNVTMDGVDYQPGDPMVVVGAERVRYLEKQEAAERPGASNVNPTQGATSEQADPSPQAAAAEPAATVRKR